MRVVSYLFIALLGLSLQSTSALAHKNHSISPVVDTIYGTVEGVEVDGFDVIAWKGMPYAKPPVGALRWKKPGDPEGWVGIRDASEYGNRCRGNEEDCLYLNVWSPEGKGKGKGKGKKGKKGKLPVIVYIHGGSNTGGSGQGNWHTTAQAYNAVVVSINYRVGAMGWFSHPALKTGDMMDDSGNFGLLDQVKALQWVQDNIEQFGGDRKNVTIAGASAGAQNVTYLMHTHLAKDLFHKAIMESNYPGIRPVDAATKSSKQVLYNLLVDDGSAANHAAAKVMADAMSDGEIKTYFYSKSRAEIRGVYRNGYWGGINWGDFYREDLITDDDISPPAIVQDTTNRPEFVYTIGDGYVLPNDIDFADFSAGHGYPKPTVVGTTLNENNAWNATWPFNYRSDTPLETLVEEAVYDGIWAYDPSVKKWVQIPGLYGATPEEFKANYKFGTGIIDELDMYLGAQLLARNMSQAKPRVPVYVYRFDWGASEKRNYKIPYEDAWKFYVGAPHVKEFNFFWQRFSGQGPGDSNGYDYNDDNLKGRLKLSEAILGYLSEFVHDKKGKIKKKGHKPEWKAWSDKKEQFIMFDGDYKHAHLKMNSKDIYRNPQQLYDAYMSYPDPQTRDFIAYYVMWSWHYNWYPNGPVDPFDTSPGPNPLFDPVDP